MTLRDPELDLAAFTLELKRRGVELSSLTLDETGTIFEPAAGEPRLGELPVVVGGAHDELALKQRISRGGMGEVMVAHQTSLRREVAVKRAAHPDRVAAERELVIEARVAGALEHPNIVPVHLLGVSAEGHPLLVMKRVEGRSWHELLREGRDLTRDVAILMDVCRALHFAHARGVVHRDVKPANVMVGTFGEVYLLDWGIAAGTGSAEVAELPAARTGARPVGTPPYMAPEMTVPDSDIDVRTDVYLAGAVLHELITGRPPHAGTTLAEQLHAAWQSKPPTFPPDTPEELADICRRALSRDPAHRHASAEELRTALERFREHAAARKLVADAEQRLAVLRALPADADGRLAQRTFNECRFGFEQALRIWSDSARAREGIEAAIVAMAERELAAGHIDSAQLLIGELARPAPALEARLAELLRERAELLSSTKELRRLERDTDRTVAQRERAALLTFTGISWLFLCVALYVLERAQLYQPSLLVLELFTIGGVVGIGAWGWRSPHVRGTAASKSAFLAMWSSMAASAVFIGVAMAVALPLASSLALQAVLLSAAIATSSAYDGRIWHSAGMASITAVLIAMFPAYALPLSGVGTLLTLLFGALWLERLLGKDTADRES
jgi:eukaryotic-like serine/threonine-protein kinase